MPIHNFSPSLSRGYSATSDEDYDPLDEAVIRFAANQRTSCVNVRPIDDAEVEGDETVFLSLSHESDLDRRIDVSSTRTTIIIIDHDS